MNKSNEALLDEYLKLPDRLEEVLAGLSETDLDLSLESGWSIREYACHLVEGEQLWQVNLRVILGLNGAKFPLDWYPSLGSQERWAEIWVYGKRSLKVLLDQYRADTQYLVDLLKNLPGNIWEHYGRITWPGAKKESRYSVRDIVEMHIGHLDGHAEDIRAIRALHGC